MISRFVFILALALAALPARAEDFTPMVNWDPFAFTVDCRGFENDGVLGALTDAAIDSGLASDCIDPDVRATFEGEAIQMLIEHKRQGFPSPLNLADVIETGEGGRAVAVYAKYYDGWAQIGNKCSPDAMSIFEVNPVRINELPRNVLAHTAAHELFHTIQKNFASHMRPGRLGSVGGDGSVNNCNPPYWIAEGMADAVAITAARRHYPSYFPPRPSQFAGDSWAGLRPYRVPIYFEGIPSKYRYRTSSFWRFIGEYYHRGRYKFVRNYADKMPPGDLKSEDWLAWLDDNLRKDPQIGLPLYLVFPGFLTHFAGEWAKGGDGEKYPREVWLARIFGACMSATVTPDAPYVEIGTAIHPMAGNCLRVTVEGLSPTQHVTVKVGSLTEDKTLADSLHLGFAFTNDQTGFNCASHRRKGHMPYGIAGCLLEPVTGTTEDGRNGRFWNGTAMEYGPGPKQSASPGAAGWLQNVYVLSRVPPEPRLAELKAVGAQPVTVTVGLEVSDLSADAGDVNKGGEDGARKAPRRRAASGMGMQPSATDQRLPAATGYIDMGPVEAILGEETVNMVTANTQLLSEFNNQFPGFTAVGQPTFRLAEVEVKPVGSPFPIDDEELVVIREFNIAPRELLPEGATGSFEAAIYGFNWQSPNIQYFSNDEQWATLTIHENSHNVFRASVSGPVCEFRGVIGSPTSPPRCTKVFQLTGSISKPYAYLYRTNSEFVSERTEGEQLYNKHHAMMTWTDGSGGGGGGGSGSGGGSGVSGGGGGGPSGGGQNVADQAPICDCACPDIVTPPSSECRAQCAPRLAQCQAAEPSDPRPKTPTVEAQRKYLSRLIGDQGLLPETEQMLLDDFSTMSDETRAYLIKQYRGGVR